LIAAYNAEAFIARAIASALAQSCADIEVVVVDDGSTDRTWALVEALARSDGRVRSARHDANRGVSAARNTAIALARGRWLAVLDADDTFHPERVACLVSHAERSGSDLLADNLMMVDEATGNEIGLAFPKAWMGGPEPLSLIDLLRRDQMDEAGTRGIGYVKPIIRRDFLLHHAIRYDEGVWAGEDFLLYAQCLVRGARFGLVSDALYLYTVRAGSLSSGQAVQFQLGEVNRRIAEMVARTEPELLRVLRRRQNSIDFAALKTLGQTGRFAPRSSSCGVCLNRMSEAGSPQPRPGG
jgi:glycosyltransferase involved in cell wall biosynthesis